jgi:hypothetical protein
VCVGGGSGQEVKVRVSAKSLDGARLFPAMFFGLTLV